MANYEGFRQFIVATDGTNTPGGPEEDLWGCGVWAPSERPTGKLVMWLWFCVSVPLPPLLLASLHPFLKPLPLPGLEPNLGVFCYKATAYVRWGLASVPSGTPPKHVLA